MKIELGSLSDLNAKIALNSDYSENAKISSFFCKL